MRAADPRFLAVNRAFPLPCPRTDLACEAGCSHVSSEERQVFCAAMEKLLQRAREGRRSCYSQIDAGKKEEGDGTCI